MENSTKPIVVPWDFSPVAENAFAHAVNICRQIGRDLLLLHIVETEDDISASTEKMKAKTEELAKQFSVKTFFLVKTGSIYEVIRDTAHDLKAEMVIMGTHGRKGMQKVTGSRALKVMANSKIPFLVVQEKPIKTSFERILFPIDFKKENKEKVVWVNYLAKNFNSTFVLYKRRSSDRGFKRRIASNLLYAETYFKNNDIKYVVEDSEGKGTYEDNMIDFASKNDIDLIVILVTRDITWLDYLLAAREQFIIANHESIPVLCLNPKPARLASGFRATGG